MKYMPKKSEADGSFNEAEMETTAKNAINL